MKKILITFVLLLSALFAQAQYPLYTPAEILQARVGTRDIRLGSYLHKNSGTLQSLKGLHLDSLLIAIPSLDSVWWTQAQSFPRKNNLDSTIIRRGVVAVQVDTLMGAGTKLDTAFTMRSNYNRGLGIMYKNLSNVSPSENIYMGNIASPHNDSTTTMITHSNPSGVETFTISMVDSASQYNKSIAITEDLGVIVTAGVREKVQLRIYGDDAFTVDSSSTRNITDVITAEGGGFVDTFFIITKSGGGAGIAKYLSIDTIRNYLGENGFGTTQTFSITLFGSQAPVTGTNVVSSDFFVVPPEMDGKQIVDIAFSYFTNPGLAGGTANFRVLNNGTPIRSFAAADNVTSGNGVPSIPTINTYQKIYAELTSETIVTDGIGLSFTITVK